MNAIRKFRTAIAAGALSFVALGALAVPADAKHPHSGVHCRHVHFGNRALFGNTLHFYPTTSLRRSYCRTGSCLTTYNLRANTIYSPVILYDSFGRPYFVNQTNYRALLR